MAFLRYHRFAARSVFPQRKPLVRPTSTLHQRLTFRNYAHSIRTSLTSSTFWNWLFWLSTFSYLVSYSFPVSIQAIFGQSMTPTLSPELASNDRGAKDYLIFVHLNAGRLRIVDSSVPTEKRRKDPREITRGTLVLFKSPQDPNRSVVKRVIGLPGDTIRPLRRYSCPEKPAQNKAGSVEEEVTVPVGHLWLEGDNPSHSYDSNDYGPVSQSLITEVAWGFAGFPLRQTFRQWLGFKSDRRPWAHVDWADDGWEERLNIQSRLKKREQQEARVDGVFSKEWQMWSSEGA